MIYEKCSKYSLITDIITYAFTILNMHTLCVLNKSEKRTIHTSAMT